MPKFILTHICLTVVCLLAISVILPAQSEFKEKDYADHIQQLIGGEREVTIKGGRIDLLTDSLAIEIEKAPNWKEAIGQSLWYAINTNKKACIILIIEKDSHYKYLIQLQSVLDYANLNSQIKVFSYPYDFKHLIKE